MHEFVEAKLLGKTELAKWALLKSAKAEIEQLVKFNQRFESLKSPRRRRRRDGDQSQSQERKTETSPGKAGGCIF